MINSKRGNVGVALAIVLIAAVGFASMISQYNHEVTNAMTGYVTAERCTESDGGIVPSRGGEVSVTYPQTAGAFTNYYYDTCLNDKTLEEVYCHNLRKETKTFPCPYGCADAPGGDYCKPKPSTSVIPKDLTPFLRQQVPIVAQIQTPALRIQTVTNIQCQSPGRGGRYGTYKEKGITKNCPATYGCVNGRCVPTVGTCRDSDGSNDPYTLGYCTDFSGTYYDLASFNKDTQRYDGVSEAVCKRQSGYVEYCDYEDRVACQNVETAPNRGTRYTNTLAGRCVRTSSTAGTAHPPTCLEVGDHDNPQTPGKIRFTNTGATYQHEYKDECSGGQTLMERFCSGPYAYDHYFDCGGPCRRSADGDYCAQESSPRPLWDQPQKKSR